MPLAQRIGILLQRAMVAPIHIVMAASLFGSGCGAGRPQMVEESQKIKSVVTEVMEDQSAPVSRDYSLKALDEYENRLLKSPGERSGLKAKTMHRLADLYLHLENRVYRQQFLRYNQQLRLVQQGKLQQRPASPKVDHARSSKIYEQLLALYPDRPENDRVLYQLARIHDDGREIDKAVSALSRLVEKYPLSPLYLESVFRLAEAYYDSNEFAKAKAAYLEVVKSKNAELAQQALYKLGWTYFSLQEYAKAAATFTELVDRKRVLKEDGVARLDPKSLSAAEWDEVLEVIRGLAFSFSYLGPPAQIYAYYDKAGHRDYEDLIYRKLGDLYMAQKRAQDGVGAYEAFITAYPLHPEAPMLQLEIIEAYQRLRLIDLANRARINFVERFGEDTPWYKKADTASQARVRPIYRKMISQLAMFYHSEAQQTKRVPDYEKALSWYRRYLRAFPKEPDAGRINFLLAEGLYELKRYEEAVDEYERTAYDYILHKDSSESGYAAILTLEKLMVERHQDFKTSPLTIRLAQDSKRFAESFSNDPRAKEVLWKAAESYYQAGNYRDARLLADLIVKGSLPTDETSVRAQRLIARSYFQERAYAEAAAAYRQLVRTGGRAGNDQELRQLWASSIYKNAEDLKAAGKLREAQTEFMRVHAEVPGSDVAPVGLFDAGTVALKRNQRDEAMQLFQIQLQRYPSHPLSQKIPDVLLQAQRTLLADGKMQEAQVLTEKIKGLETLAKTDLAYRSERLLADRLFEDRDYGQAAAAYQKLAREDSSPKSHEKQELQQLWASALYKQAETLKKTGKDAEAQATFMRVQAQMPMSDVAPVALYDAGGIALSRGDQEGALRAFTILLNDYPASPFLSQAAVQIAVIYENSGRLRDAALNYESVLKLTQDRKTLGEAVLAAGRLYEKLEDWPRASANFALYLNQYPGEFEQVVDTTYRMALSKLKEGRRKEALSISQGIIDRYGHSGLTDSQIRYYVAKAYLMKADELMVDFDQIRLVSPLEKNLARKRDSMKSVLGEYANAVDYDVAEVTTAATQKIGMVFEKFRTALLESERPGDLTPQQLEQYEFLIEEQAFPFEEKAIAAYESNVRRAQQLGLYDSWIRQSYDELARLIPARYGKREMAEMVHPELLAVP